MWVLQGCCRNSKEGEISNGRIGHSAWVNMETEGSNPIKRAIDEGY
jgi:hypothetical protein